MATSKELISYMLDLCGGDDLVRARPMFGEYGVYYGDKLSALVCDETLFVKPTEGGRALAGDVEMAPSYPGAKPALVIPEDLWDQPGWLAGMLRVTAAELPAPKPRKKKSAPKT